MMRSIGKHGAAWADLPDLDRDDSRPLYVQVAEVLEKRMEAGSLASGVLVPSELELIHRYGVSRTTVRQAIQRLEDKGLVLKVHGKGTFVAAFKRKNRLTAFRSVEPVLSERGLIVKNIILDLNDGASPQWAVNLGFPMKDRVRVFKRLKMVEERPLALEMRVLPVEVADLLSEDDLVKRPFYDVLDTCLETKIQHVTYSITGGVASVRLAQDMGVARGTPLVIRHGLYYTLFDQPIMAAKVYFVAERIELRFEFDRKDDNWGIVIV
ncbi:MAG: GntR family transcriptional regulator [Thermodesulfobacteriota bacterium]